MKNNIELEKQKSINAELYAEMADVESQLALRNHERFQLLTSLTDHRTMISMGNARLKKILADQEGDTDAIDPRDDYKKHQRNQKAGAVVVLVVILIIGWMIGSKLNNPKSQTIQDASASTPTAEVVQSLPDHFVDAAEMVFELPPQEISDRPDWTLIRPEVVCHGEDPTQRYPIRQYSLQGKRQNWTCIPQYLVDDLEQASLDYSINVNMLAGLFNTESAFDPNAVSDAGAQGCAQFMPSTWNWLYSIGVFTGDMDVWSCEDSVRMAAIKLSRDGWSDSGGWKQALYAYLGAGADWYVERVQFWGNLYQNEVV